MGSTARLNCSAVATQNDDSTEFTWFKYGRPLLEVTSRQRDSIFRLGRHVLVFDEILLADAGRYMCMRITGHKTENRTFNLSVKGRNRPDETTRRCSVFAVFHNTRCDWMIHTTFIGKPFQCQGMSTVYVLLVSDRKQVFPVRTKTVLNTVQAIRLY